MEKPTINQKVFLLQANHRGGFYDHLQAVTVSKVGRIYFELKEFSMKFRIDDLQESCEFGGRSKVYLNSYDFLDEKECEILERKIRDKMKQYGRTKYTLKDLKAVHDILTTTR